MAGLAMQSKAYEWGVAIGEALPYVLAGLAALVFLALVFLAFYFLGRRGRRNRSR